MTRIWPTDIVPARLAALPEALPGGLDVTGARPVVVLDDDPTGTQTIRGVPVLTCTERHDLHWAFSQAGPGFFILTNTRSLDPGAAAERVREIAARCREVASSLGLDPVFLSRGDSTLRGHFPLETDVLAQGEEQAGRPVDAVVLVPAYLDAGRVTVDGVHYVVGPDAAAVPVGETEFARDATFGFSESSLPRWVQEKTKETTQETTGGAVRADQVCVVTLDDIRRGGVTGVLAVLREARDRQVVAVDAARDDDLRIVSAAILRAEAEGRRFVYRSGPSFVRARLGQVLAQPVATGQLVSTGARAATGGLVVVGSHVGLTTRQLDRLLAERDVEVVELDVQRPGDDAHRVAVADALVAGLDRGCTVLRTSRALRVGGDADASLAIARDVSAAVVAVVRATLERRRPAFLVAKGGITSSDVATEALGMRRAHVEGTVLPGIVSVWRPVDGRAPGLPYVVFAGNVGTDDGLLQVVDRLSAAAAASQEGVGMSQEVRVAVIGLGAMGLPMATRLAERFPVSAYDPDAARGEVAAAHGITLRPDPAAAAQDADVVLVAVRDATQVRQAVLGERGVAEALGADGVVILTSTIGLAAATSLAADLAERGIALVDAPISGGPLRAGKGDLLIVVGAEPQVRARVHGVLDQLSSTLTVVGDRPGDGQIVKTINQLLAGVHIAAAAEALALGRELGLDPAGLVPVLSAGAAGSFMLADRGERMAQAYTGGAEVRSRLDIFVKDMGIVAELARAAHVPTPLAAAAEQLYTQGLRAGLGACDDSSVVTLLSPPGPDPVSQ